MKMRKYLELKSFFLLVLIIAQTVYPATALALADVPDQPEFSSYESFNNTDMVNLISGDFTYNIPLLNVPSPEGGYQLPLSYHAGIELNEESSWVGLGWGLNPGAITRNVSVFPDDFSGEQVETTVTNPGGNGYIKSYPFYTQYYDSEKGRGGSIDLFGIIDFGWGTQNHFGIAPLGLTLKDGGISYDYEYMLEGVGAAMQLVAGFYAGPLYSFASSAIDMYMSLGSGSPAGLTYFGKWTLETSVKKRTTHYKWYMKDDVKNSEYGTLFLGDMPTYNAIPESYFNAQNGAFPITSTANNKVRAYATYQDTPETYPSSDMHMSYEGNYGLTYNPASLAYDNFNVQGAGVSGPIKPYREDIGTLSNPTAILDFENDIFVGPRYINTTNYKVQFKYAADYSNSYSFHYMGTNPNLQGQAFPYDFDGTQLNANNYDFKFAFKDPKVYLNYYAYGASGIYDTGYDVTNRIEQNRNGRFDKKLIHRKHIEWYTNSKISDGSAKSNGFVTSHQSVPRSSPLPQNGIGGFSITNEAGYTYHYSIPVYNKGETINAYDNSSSTTYVVENPNYYATAWLLTGITGPDFVDRGTDGVIDNQDYGYWVQFDYGKFAENYSWRSPFFGQTKNGSIDTYKIGVKQTYYLNKIATRSHTALFVKSVKMDGKGFYKQGTASDIPASSSLKLDNIYVLANSDYEKLVTATGSGGIGLVSTGTTHDNELRASDTYNNILDNYDVSSPSIQNFLTANQLQKFSFNYDYELCPKTINSFNLTASTNAPNYDPSGSLPTINSDKAKLTLKSVGFYGKNNFRIMPSYLFDYTGSVMGHNPDYHPYKWDGYGMYKSGGDGDESTAHNAEKIADQWSLTKITTPLGAEISIDYERDDYTSVNGKALSTTPLKLDPISYSGTNVTFSSKNYGATSYISDFIKVGQAIIIKYFDTSTSLPGMTTRTVTAVSQYGLTMNSSFSTTNKLGIEFGVITDKKYGGGIRVKKITTKDESGHEYTTKYFYTNDGTETGVSTGVASFESEYDRTVAGDFDFYKLCDHPFTPIFYSKVTVVNGQYGPVFNETSKKSFHFVTPHYNMLEVVPNVTAKTLVKTKSTYRRFYHTRGQFETIDKTAKIGSIDTIKEYNKFNHVINKTVFNYTDNSSNEYGNNMGAYTENNILWESINYNNVAPYHDYNLRFFQSYKLKRPNILKSVVTYKDRLTSKQEILAYDFFTGEALTTKNTFGANERYEQTVVPIYQKQGYLGSKVNSPTYKNLMTQPCETYSYVYDKYGQKKLLGATVLKYFGSGPYREYNSGTQDYSSLNAGYTTQLPFQTFNWKSAVEENGTIADATFIPFTWSGNNDPKKWVKTSEVTLYDHFSHKLEVKDLANKYQSVRYGYDNSFPISSCPARYVDWCSSGAEDKSQDANYYSGEVKGSNYQFASTFYAHTGNYCSKMGLNEIGFSYKIPLSGFSLPISSTVYRASVWVHQDGATGAELRCYGLNSSGAVNYLLANASYNNTNFNNNSSCIIEQAGDWYLFSLDLKMSSIPQNVSFLLFEVKNNATSAPIVYADDFRVHPLSSPIVANVYDPKSGRTVATLDKENYATVYEYDNGGKLKTVYKETKIGFRRISESKYNFNRNN